MTALQDLSAFGQLPEWLPQDARRYLAHTAGGHSIRALARADACHPSTVLRQVRRFENRRDDPLLDGAIQAIACKLTSQVIAANHKGLPPMHASAVTTPPQTVADLTEEDIDRELCRILRRLCETGAVLAVARDLEHAVVVREDANGQALNTTVVRRQFAEALSLREWIASTDLSARIARYSVTAAGREAFRRLTAASENRAQGFRAKTDQAEAELKAELVSRHAPESPLVGLSRRRDRDGSPFLSRSQIAAGERLREDFELSGVRLTDADGWQGAFADATDEVPSALGRARGRARAALTDLGPGLADVALRCCCLREGLETTEKSMGWSARSGKVVLRIALDRLAAHYAAGSEADQMIG